MLRPLYAYLLLVSLTLAAKTGVDLPLCPRHLEYFPQELPMHCRMPRNADEAAYRSDGQEFTLPPNQYPYFRRSDKEPPPVPLPIPPFPGMPGMLPGMPPGMPGPMPPGMPGPMPPGMPGPMPPGMPGPPPPGMPGMPMPIPMPLPMPMPGSPAHKLPVIVMPFYSPDRKSFTAPPRHKKTKRPHKKRPHYSSSSSDDSDDTSDSNGSSDDGWWKPPKRKRGHKKYGIFRRFNKHHNMRKKEKKGDLLTPVLQYLTKDGYVIYEKKITKNEASNWLGSKEQAKAQEEIKFKKELEAEPQNKEKNDRTATDIQEQEELPQRETSDKNKANSEKSTQSIENLFNDVPHSKTENPPKKIKRKRFKE